ncbi:MAG: ADP-ribosyl-[dinitrogen reductase] hydrolase [Zoogloea sp.]|uniref:ADP-ribosyl-[dinitrogen reductase] hydrolase n=1 Tax=Zoogloea sp. TaxID=49181 RepID=UPI003F3A3E9B
MNSPSSELIRRAEAAYLGMAIGDALGATVEFLTPREIRAQYGIHREIVGGGWLKLKAGQITDDTTMALALGEALIRQGGEIDGHSCACAFDDWMRGKPVDIGNTVRRNLVLYRRSNDPIAPYSEHDAGNGAAMRVLPVALAYHADDESSLRTAARVQAHVTHNNSVSDAACEFLVLALRDCLYGTTLRDLYRQRIQTFTATNPIYQWRGRRLENPGGYVVDTLRAVMQSLMETGSFEDCLLDMVNRGGDADTTGAIAGMLAGALYGEEEIPPRWLNALAPGVEDRCRQQAKTLVGIRQKAAQAAA